MPAFDLTVPRVSAIASTYPLGGQVTVSSAHWDARGAVLNSAPTRNYAVGRPSRPQQTPVFVAGAGVTPFTGLRVGASFAQGDYATAEEVTGPVQAGRSVAIVGGEGEYAFGPEDQRSFSQQLRRPRAGRHIRWFMGASRRCHRAGSGRQARGTKAPPLITATTVGGHAPQRPETAVGFRVTPEVTFAAFCTRRSPTHPPGIVSRRLSSVGAEVVVISLA
jgi:hypothetical protein